MNMQVQFNRPVTLRDEAGQEKPQTFGTGTYPVPEALTKGWFFEGLVKEGHAMVLREAPVAPEPAPARASAALAAAKAATDDAKASADSKEPDGTKAPAKASAKAPAGN